MQYNPTELIRKLHCNSLIVQGNNDIQVDLEEAQVLSGACVKAELLVINKMNHVLKTVEGDMQQNLATYSDPSLPVNQEMVQGIVKFIHNN